MCTVIPPMILTDSMIVSNVPETIADAPVWSNATTYAAGNVVSKLIGTKYTAYRSLVSSNTNNDPAATLGVKWEVLSVFYAVYSGAASYAVDDYVYSITAGTVNGHKIYKCLAAGSGHALTDSTSWYYVGLTNRFAMFDSDKDTQTEITSPLIVTITPGIRSDAIGLSGLVGENVNYVVTSSGVGVYNKSSKISTRNTTSYYQYCFGRFGNKESTSKFDLPPYVNAVITMTLSKSSGSVKLGGFVLGMHEFLGTTQVGATDSINNFSTFDRNFAGNATLIPKRNVPKPEMTLLTSENIVDRVRKVRNDLGGSVAYWSGLEDETNPLYNSLVCLGVYKQFDIGLVFAKGETETHLSLEGF